jgi:CHAT domain-containing protein
VSWEIVDVPAHPELREAPEELVETRCPMCGELVGIDRPFLLLDPLPGVPLVSVGGWAPPGKEGSEKVAAVAELPPPPPGILVEADRRSVPLLLTSDDLDALFATLECLRVDSSDDQRVRAEGLTRALNELVRAQRYLATFMASLEISSVETFVEFMDAYGGTLKESHFQDYLDALLADTDRRGVAEAAVVLERQLLRRLGQDGNPTAAWHQHQKDREQFFNDTLTPELVRITDGLSGSVVDPGARMALYEDGLTLAEVTGNRKLAARLLADRGGKRLQSFSIYHAGDFAAGEADLRQALELIESDDPALAARCAMNLGMALVHKSRGDQRENVEEARALLHRALEYFTEDEDPDSWAMTVTNLSVVYEARETGGKAENLRIAEEFCRSAYRVRSRERNAVDWAYTTANLAFILIAVSRISSLDDDAAGAIEEALRLCGEAAAVFTDAGETRVAADVLHNSAVAGKVYVEQSSRRRLVAAARDTVRRPAVGAFLAMLGRGPSDKTFDEWVVDVAGLLGLNPRLYGFEACPAWAEELNLLSAPNAAERVYLSTALAQAEQARTLREPVGGIAYAISCLECARLHQLFGTAEEQSCDLLEQALAAVDVYDGPQLVLEVGSMLGELHAKAGRWAGAARAYARGVAALDWRYAERLTGDKRIDELKSVTKLVEWAAYAHAAAGDPEGAVRLLEDGRARGLSDDMALESAAVARLREHVPRLAAEFDHLRQRLAAAVAAEQQAAATTRDGIADRTVIDQLIMCRREYAALLDRIRKVETFGDFLARTSDAEIAALSRADAPLIYLVATAAGSMSLVVEPADEDSVGPPGLSVTALPSDVTSAELVRCLGYYQADGQLGLLSGRDGGVAAVLPETQNLLGRAFGHAVSRELARRGARRAYVVAAGILSALPISAALCDETDPEAVLADHVAVTFAPSARVQSICERRRDSRRGDVPRLVAVGNPGGDLPWSTVEVDEMAKLFPGATVRTVQAATRDFLIHAAGEATHLHLACHGYSSIVDPASSGIGLADGVLTVRDLLAGGGALRCRLAVLSACESGRIDVANTPNEFRGLPQAFITLGSAAVIATLWRVEDLPTAMLLIKFYENLKQLGDDTGHIALALQQAQQWLRGVTRRDVELFVATHGMRPVAAGERGPMLERVKDWFLGANRSVESSTPFRDARYWAAFVMVGA